MNHTVRGRACRLLCALSVATLCVALHPGPAVAETSGSPRVCRELRIPVSMAPGDPANQRVHGELCTPSGQWPATVMLLTHGVTYDHHYFDFPGFGGRYSYARSANKAGYATLAIDRLGSGSSSRPPGREVEANAHVWVAHQIIQKLRSGAIDGASGSTGFDKVIHVGHSYGSGLAWMEASRFSDVDAVIVTGANHFIRMDTVTQVLAPSLAPAVAVSSRSEADPYYLTTRPGTRYANFMAPGNVEPAVVAADEALKQTVTLAELTSISSQLGSSTDVKVPVLLAQGDKDTLFCGAGVTCDDERQLLKAEAPHLGNPRCIAGYLHPGAGHDNVLMRNAQDFFDALNSWSRETVAPDGRTPRRCAAFDPAEFKSIDPGQPSTQETDVLQRVTSTPAAGPPLNSAGQLWRRLLDGPVSDAVFPRLPVIEP